MKNIKLIAETAWHHQGSFDFQLNLVQNILENCSPSFIKLHVTLDADEYMQPNHKLYKMTKSSMFSKEQWVEVIGLVREQSAGVLLLYNDTKAVELGSLYKPEIVEIHSVCLNDIHLLDSLRYNIDNNTKVMFGVGGSTLYEIEKAIERIRSQNIILMHGFQNYPTKHSDVNFAKMQKIMQLYPDFKHGYADHSAWNEPNNLLITLMGAALGMNYVEKHVTTEYGKERVDYSAAISLEMFNELNDKLKVLSECFGNGLLEMNQGEKDYAQFGIIKKAGFVACDIKAGVLFSEDKLVFKRTGLSASLSQLDVLNCLGKEFSKDYKQNTLITKDMFKQ